jgi:hypothetical protein
VEQRRVAAAVAARLRPLEELQQQVRHQQELLYERKQALITAVVTGQKEVA